MDEVARLAARQDSVLSIDDAAACGVNRRQLLRAERSGGLMRLHNDVFAVAGASLSRRSHLRAAAKQVREGFVSHEGALVLGGVQRVPMAVPITVGRNAAGHTHRGIRVHRVRDLLEEHVTEVDGIPTTTLERAIVDVASVFSVARMGDLLDQVTIERRMTTIDAIGRVLRQVNRKGRLGIGRLPPMLEARSSLEPTPRSHLERRVDDLLANAPLPLARHEHPLPSDRGYRGYVDRCWTDAMLIVEIDGRPWHARERAMARDRARDREAARQGWQTLRVLDDEVRRSPDGVVDDVVTSYEMRLTQLERTA
jgi:hypothetical protein